MEHLFYILCQKLASERHFSEVYLWQCAHTGSLQTNMVQI